MLAWLVVLAVCSVHLGRRGTNGKTAYELRHGRKRETPLGSFGEKMLWLPAGKRISRGRTAWKEGGSLGSEKGDFYQVGTPSGVERARASPGLCWDAEFLLSVQCAPWDTAGGAAPAGRTSLGRDEVSGYLPPPPPRDPDALRSARTLYVRKDVELARYGFTPRCECRTWIVAPMQAAGNIERQDDVPGCDRG